MNTGLQGYKDNWIHKIQSIQGNKDTNLQEYNYTSMHGYNSCKDT